jgi:putative transposase
MATARALRIPLPKSWNEYVRSAVLHVISLAQFSLAHARGRAAYSLDAQTRQAARCDRLQQEVVRLREEIRIKDARMGRIEPRNRPHYPAQERLAILMLRSARGWSLEQTAKTFLVTKATIAYWNRCLREDGSEALVAKPEPINKYPDFVRYIVQQFKTLCPTLGKVKIADILGRAGLHLAASTVGRIVKEKPVPPPTSDEQVAKMPTGDAANSTAKCVVTANRPNHVWHVDLTTIPILSGFWTPWSPNALPQSWPFCWWVAVVVDHFSRRAMGFYISRRRPTTQAVQAFLDRTMQNASAAPKYLISDQGVQFACFSYQEWCQSRGIAPRYGAVGQHGSIAVVERFIRTLKETIRQFVVSPRRRSFLEHVLNSLQWYNAFRPHMTLTGKTPNEVYHALPPANEEPRIEPRPHWPVGAPCAKPRVPIDGEPGGLFQLHVAYHAQQRHLPVVALRRAA